MRPARRGRWGAWIGCDNGPHLAKRAMQPGLDRADRDRQGHRDVGQGHPQEVVQDDDRALLRIEVAHGLVDEVAIGKGAGHIGVGRRIDREQFHFDDATTSTPRLVEAGVDGQSMEPGVEPLGVTQTREIAPCSDQDFLDRVAGQLRIPEDETGRFVQPRDGSAGELGEGVMIAPPRSLDESSLVHGRLGFGAPSWRAR